MNKDALVKIGLIITVLVISVFSGCTSTDVEEKDLDVFFKSEVVNLVNYTFNIDKNKQGKVYSATVTGRVENKVKRIIDIEITAEFYDEEGTLLIEKTYTIIGLRVKPNPGYTTTFEFIYNEDENVQRVNNVKLYAEEIV